MTVMEVLEGAVEYLVVNNIVQYASKDKRDTLMSKADAHRTEYLQHVRIGAFCQSLSIVTKKCLSRNVANVARVL